MSPTTEDKQPVTRGEAKIVWLAIGVAVTVLVTMVVPIGAYFRLDAKVVEVDRRISIMETKQDASDRTLRGIENSVSRIEGRLKITPEADK